MLDPDRVEFFFEPLFANDVRLFVVWEFENVLEVCRGGVRRRKDLVL